MTRIRISTTVLGGTLLLLAGCGSSPQEVETRVTSTATVTASTTTEVTVTATPTPEVTVTPTPTAKATAAPPQASGDSDLTQQLLAANPREPWGPKVISVKVTGGTDAEVRTTIVDPRGGNDGSPEARAAIAICKATVTLLKSKGVDTPLVRVMESNDTTFAYISPRLSPTCVEY